MRAKVAKRYAKALFDAAIKANALEAVHQGYLQLAGVVRDSENLRYYLGEPRIPIERKRKTIQYIFDEFRKSVTEDQKAGLDLIADFIDLLLKKNRQSILLDVNDELDELYNRHHNRLPAYVTTAVPLSDEQATQLKARLEAATGKSIELIQNIDERIIGGVVVRIQDLLIDGSIQSAMRHMRQRLLSRVSH
ncbi:MAG: ATP synthase F1 subunit delta [Gemmatimonadetes bacterium]|nr:MAG: ATP synthase F1 subunit delta [Gemmatimonadota bacterium]